MKKLIASLSLLSIATCSSNFFFSLPAQALNGGTCSKNSTSLNASNGATYIPNATVTFTNSTSSTVNAIINFSADVAMTPGAYINVSYGVDGNYPGEFIYGPANFATYSGAQGSYETRSTIAVVAIPPGIHTIQPVWRVGGGQSGYMYTRCITVISP